MASTGGATSIRSGSCCSRSLTGRLPFRGASLVSVALKHKTEPPPLPRSLRVEVPAWLERIVLRCLEKDPTRRFATAEELVAELRRPRKGRSPEVAPPAGRRQGHGGRRRLWRVGPRPRLGPREDGMVARVWPCVSASATTVSPPSTPRRAERRRGPYGFVAWPQGEVFRRLVDYEEDRTARAGGPARRQPGRPSQGVAFPRQAVTPVGLQCAGG